MTLLQEARQSPVTVLFFAANVLMFVWMVIQGVDAMNPTVGALLHYGANSGEGVAEGEWWRLLTCMFLHGGLIHLVVNMYSLRILGPFIEGLFGSATFFLVYMIAGFGGSVASCLWNPIGVSIGASGAIFGLLGALIAFFLTHRRAMRPDFFRSSIRRFVLVVGLNLFIGFTIPQIDNSAHMGGLLAGFVCGLAARRPAKTPPTLGFARFARLAIVALVIAGIAFLVPGRVDAARAEWIEQQRIPLDSRPR
jgi:rhomboid protease GluP